MPDAAVSPVAIFPVDVEHAGIRLALPVIIIVGGLIVYIALLPLVTSALKSASGASDGSGVLTFIIAFVGALGIGALAERLLKRTWPSGRSVRIDLQALHLQDLRRNAGRADTSINLSERVNALTWRFTVKRSSPRAPSGWTMLACQLSQENAQVIMYAFLSPKALAALPTANCFTVLAEQKVISDGKLPLREQSEQRRLIAAENNRWQDGAELQPNDFTRVLTILAPHLADQER